MTFKFSEIGMVFKFHESRNIFVMAYTRIKADEIRIGDVIQFPSGMLYEDPVTHGTWTHFLVEKIVVSLVARPGNGYEKRIVCTHSGGRQTTWFYETEEVTFLNHYDDWPGKGVVK